MRWQVILVAAALLLFGLGCGTEVVDLWPAPDVDAAVQHAEAGQDSCRPPDQTSVPPPSPDLSSDQSTVSPTQAHP